MTNGQKVGAGALATVLAILTLLLSTQGLAFVQWAFGEVRLIAGAPLFGATSLAVLVGAVAPAWLPHVLPACWPRHVTLRVTRMLGFGIAFVMMVARYPSPIGVQYGLFAGSGAYMAWTVGTNLIYRLFPALKPQALVDRGDAYADDGSKP